MGEFFQLLKRFDWKGIFLTPTNNGFLQFFRYAFVGGIATVADWLTLVVLTNVGLHYQVSAVFGFFAGLVTNFALSKLLVFQKAEAKVGTWLEFTAYGVIGAIGLGITLLIMHVLTEMASVHYFLSKVVATVIVLIWNYAARKKLLYR